jgi:hypothetical protein
MPKRGFQLLLSLNIRLRSGSPAWVAVMIGRLAATLGTRSDGMLLPATTMLPVGGSNVNMRLNFSTQGV